MTHSIDWLEEQRCSARLQLGDILIGGIHNGICAHRCGWSSKYAYAYLKSLERKHLWPTGLVGVSESIKRAEMMPDPVPEEPSIACTYERNYDLPDYRSSRRWGLGNCYANHIMRYRRCGGGAYPPPEPLVDTSPRLPACIRTQASP